MRARPHNTRDASSGSAMDASNELPGKAQNGQRSTVFEDAQWCSGHCHLKRSNDAVLKQLQKVSVSDACISAITKSELLFGVEVSPRRRQDEAALSAFLRYIEVLDFPDEASLHYAKIRADLT